MSEKYPWLQPGDPDPDAAPPPRTTDNGLRPGDPAEQPPQTPGLLPGEGA